MPTSCGSPVASRCQAKPGSCRATVPRLNMPWATCNQRTKIGTLGRASSRQSSVRCRRSTAAFIRVVRDLRPDRTVAFGHDRQRAWPRARAFLGTVCRLDRMDRRLGCCRRLRKCHRDDRDNPARSALGSFTHRPRAVVAGKLSTRQRGSAHGPCARTRCPSS
jgi:hypothetical protein